MKAVEKDKDDLEGAKNEAVEYLTMENDIVKKKNVMFQKYMYVPYNMKIDNGIANSIVGIIYSYIENATFGYIFVFANLQDWLLFIF